MIRPLLAVASPEAGRLVRWNLAGLIAESVLIGIGFALLVPVLRALFAQDTAAAWSWVAVMAGVLAVYAMVRFRTQLVGYMAGMTIARGLFARLGDHIARLPLGWFQADRVGKVGRLTSQGVIHVLGVPAHLLRPFVSGIVTPITVVALMFIFDWRLALAALVTAPVAFAVFRWAGSLVQRADHRTDAAAVEAGGRLVEFAQSQAVLRAFGRVAGRHRLLDDALQEQRDAGRAQIISVVPGMTSFVLVVQLAFTIVMLYGTTLALGGRIDVPEMLALMVLTVRYVEPMIMVSEIGGAMRIARNSLTRMDELLATPPLAEAARPAPVRGSEIVFDRVSFAYDDRPVLTDVSFAAPAQAITALVGPSGSGKTTVARLVARFWDVDAGSVRIGGTDVREFSTADLMAQLSLVFQDVYLFDGSIAENIRMGRADATDAEVREAAHLARVDEIVERLPDGFDTRVGEGGAALSGGERQRVSIARALLKNTPIVLLDEATAALDPENERAVQDGLRVLAADRTLLVIAHRLQTVETADRIVVLDGGQIVEQGTHRDLLEAKGRYAAFWSERKRATGWRLTFESAEEPA